MSNKMKEILKLAKKYWVLALVGSVLLIGSVAQSATMVRGDSRIGKNPYVSQRYVQHYRHSSQIASYNIGGIRGYGNLEAVKTHIANMLMLGGVPNTKIYVKADLFDAGVNDKGESIGQVYLIHSISVFTTTELKEANESLIKELIRDNIHGSYTIKVYGTLNMGK